MSGSVGSYDILIADCLLSLNTGVIPGSEVKYVSKVVAPTLDVVRSIGGFRTLPDYSFQTMPADYAALILVGGMQWQSPEAELVVPIVQDALQRGKIVGAICNASAFPGIRLHWYMRYLQIALDMEAYYWYALHRSGNHALP